jgi:hypothetical protein
MIIGLVASYKIGKHRQQKQVLAMGSRRKLTSKSIENWLLEG